MGDIAKNVNFKQNPWSTGIGLIILIVGIVTIFIDNVTVVESIAIIILGAGFMGIKDPRIKGGAKLLTFVGYMLLLTYLLSGCARRTLVPQTITVRDTVTVPIMVPISSDSVQVRLTTKEIETLPADSSGVIARSSEGRSRVTIIRKPDNSIVAKAECLPDTVELIKEIPIKIEADCPPVLVKELSFWQKAWDGFKTLSSLIVIVLLAVIIIRRRLRI